MCSVVADYSPWSLYRNLGLVLSLLTFRRRTFIIMTFREHLLVRVLVPATLRIFRTTENRPLVPNNAGTEEGNGKLHSNYILQR